MRVIRDNQVIEDDWVELGDEQSITDGDVIVSLDRWLGERDALRDRNGRLGVRINGDHDLDSVIADLDAFDLIALEFPRFVDGRNYSNARLLRERHGYRGELRAVGDVLRDQLFFMARCGIDSFAIADRKDAEDALRGLQEFTLVYQPAADGRVPVPHLRHG